MTIVNVERLGGLAGFGGAASHLRSQGSVALETLSSTDQQTVEDLFEGQPPAPAQPGGDRFRYRLSRTSPQGIETVEVSETQLPEALRQCVRDALL